MMDGGNVAFRKGIYHIKPGVMRKAGTHRCLNDMKCKSLRLQLTAHKSMKGLVAKICPIIIIFFYIFCNNEVTMVSHNIRGELQAVREVNIKMLNRYVVPIDLFADTVVFRQSL